MARSWQLVRGLIGYDYACIRVKHLLGWSLGGACSRMLLILISTWHATVDINWLVLHARVLLIHHGVWRHLLLQGLKVSLSHRLRVMSLCLRIPSLIKAISIEPRLVIVWHRLSKHDFMRRWHHFNATSLIG